MSLRVLSIGTLPPGSIHRVSIKREMLHFQSLPWHVLHSLQGSQYRSPTPRIPSHSSHRQRRSIAVLLSLEVPGKWIPPPPPSSPTGPLWIEISIFRAFLDVPLCELNSPIRDKSLIIISGLFPMTSFCVTLDSTKQSHLHVHILACVCVYTIFFVIWCLVLCTLNNVNMHQLYCVLLSTYSSSKWGIMWLGGNSFFMMFT